MPLNSSASSNLNWKPDKLLKLNYKQFLPKWFYPSLLGSWVSPFQINWTNKAYDGDQFNVSRRLRQTPSKMVFSKIMKQAFDEGWFTWKFINVGQLHYYEDIRETDTWKILMVKFNLHLFRNSNGYRRYLSLVSIIEYFTKKYNKGKIRVVFYVFNENPKLKTPLFNKWSSKYESYYLETQTFSLLGAVTILTKLVSLAKQS
jgi:hypothetical protein